MSLVSNTGPLIALAKADSLFLLPSLYSIVFVPPSVSDELLAKESPESDRLAAALSDFLQVRTLDSLSPEVAEMLPVADSGERDAVALAHQLVLAVLLDDRTGRAAARRLGVTVFGTAGLLVEAKKSGLIAGVRPLLEQIRNNGYWLSDALIEQATILAGE